jgi:DNA-binding MurR/RpiR family transcriptional regulator
LSTSRRSKVAVSPEQADKLGVAGAMLMRIRNTRIHLSRSEAQVADSVIADPRLFVNSPISEIASAANVSQPTVIRFCRSMGCEGLQDFKLKLSGTLNNDSAMRFSPIEEGDSLDDICTKVLNNTASALLTLREEVEALALEQAIAVLKSAKHVAIFALGSSASVADDAQYKLVRAGINAAARTDGYMMNLCAQQLSKNDVAMFVSRSGQTPELLEAASIAQEQGAKVFSLAPSNSALAKKSNAVIVVNTNETRQTKPAMLTRILQLALIDVLAVGLTAPEDR